MLDTTRYLLLITKLKRRYEAACQPVCRRHGLLQIDFDILAFLHNNPAYDTARDIVELRGLQKGNVSTAVDRLIRKGYLARRSDPNDRRLVHLSLTPAAKPALEEITALQEALSQKLLSPLAPEDQARLLGFLGELSAALDAAEPGGETL